MKRRSNSLAIGVAVVLIFLLSSSPAAAEIVTFIPISDAVIRSDSPYENFSYVSLRVKREASTGLRSWSYVQFDLSSIPPNSRIDSAVLSLYAWWAIPPENFPVSVFRCTESWSDSSITYANKPASNSDPAGESIFASTLSVYQNIDITGLVQGWVNGDYPNNGFKLGSSRFSDPSATFSWNFDGRTTNYPPNLVINYAPPTSPDSGSASDSAPASGTSPGKTVPTTPSSATVSSIKNVRVKLVKESSAYITWTTEVDSNSYVEYGETTKYGKMKVKNDQTTAHSVQLIELKSGKTYHFRVMSTTADGHQVVSKDYTFRTTKEMKPEEDEKNNIWLWITIGVLGLLVLVLAGILVFLYIRNRRRKQSGL